MRNDGVIILQRHPEGVPKRIFTNVRAVNVLRWASHRQSFYSLYDRNCAVRFWDRASDHNRCSQARKVLNFVKDIVQVIIQLVDSTECGM